MFRRRERIREEISEIVDKFRQKGATSPEKAMTAEELNLPPEFKESMKGRLGQMGIFVEVDGKYYLSEQRLEEVEEQIAARQPTISPLRRPTLPPSYPPARDMARRYANYGLLCAILSLLIMPEIFGPAAIILGAYAWKMEISGSNRGLFIVVLGIISMLLGIYFTAPIYLGGF